MNIFKLFTTVSLIVLTTQIGYSQQVDSTQAITAFSGSVGITNNGFSIIPTFSLNNPATIMNFSWRKKKFSFDPDIRLVPNASKGGMLFWLHYYMVEKKKFKMRVGVHPAFTFVRRNVNDNGINTEITEVLRFAAGELASSYQIMPNWSIEAVYLHGSGLQTHGPQNTDVLFLNTSISNIRVGGDFRFQIIPMVYFLNTDGFKGNYFSATGIFSHRKSPFSLQAAINQTFTSNVPDNQFFMWNVMLSYNISKKLKRVN